MMKQCARMNTANWTFDDNPYKRMMENKVDLAAKLLDLNALPRFLPKMMSESTPRGGIFESGHPDAAKNFLMCTTSTGRNAATKLLDLNALPRFWTKNMHTWSSTIAQENSKDTFVFNLSRWMLPT